MPRSLVRVNSNRGSSSSRYRMNVASYLSPPTNEGVRWPEISTGTIERTRLYMGWFPRASRLSQFCTDCRVVEKHHGVFPVPFNSIGLFVAKGEHGVDLHGAAGGDGAGESCYGTRQNRQSRRRFRWRREPGPWQQKDQVGRCETSAARRKRR